MNQIIFQDQIEKISHFIELKDDLKHVGLNNKDQILKNLSFISKFAFDKDFNNFRLINNSFRFLFQNLNSEESNSTFTNYIRDFDSQDFLQKFPLLPKLIDQKIQFSSEYIKTIYRHFSNDRKAISALFNKNEDVGDIVQIELDYGDVHQGGKTTAIIYFENNLKTVYKSRSSAIDLAFNNLITNINRDSDCIDLKTVKTLDKEQYCWMEFIENKACETLADLQDYYKRCGVLTALTYFLRGTDMHFENIIANGSYPMLIDLECLFNTNLVNFNVLHTGLIPVLSYTEESSASVDLSAFGASGIQESSSEIWNWKFNESDNPNLVKEKGKFKASDNQPKFNGESISPKEFIGDFIREFEKTCHYILKIKPSFHEENHLFSEFKDKLIRIIPRPTQDYKSILENSYIPEALISEENRKLIIEKYLKDFFLIINFNEDDKNKIVASELKSIQQMDIPYFTSNTTQKKLLESGIEVLPEYFKISPYDYVLEELEKLNQAKIDQQIKIIKSAFSVRYGIQNSHKSDTAEQKKNNTIPEEINQIAVNLKDYSELNHNTYNWYSFESTDSKSLTYGTMDNSLYSGSLGIAFYLAAVSKYANSMDYDKIISTVLESQIHEVLSNQEDELRKYDISFSTGISGLIYALLTINPEKYKEQALQLSHFITLESVLQNGKIDIMAGASGCLAVMVKLYSLTKEKVILHKCISIGNHMNRLKYIDAETNLAVWNSDTTKKPLTGFSHGVSGVGYAFLKLFEITGNNDYKSAFYETLDYENHFYNDEEKNWADLRNKENKFQNSWCYGASGIGLNRLYAYQILKDENLLADIENAIAVTKERGLLDSEFYCCGNVGRMDFLIEASKVLKDEKLKDFIKNKLEGILKKKSDSNYFQTFSNKNISIENPSLFRGTSGIGYTLLRSLDSDNFPCFGLLE